MFFHYFFFILSKTSFLGVLACISSFKGCYDMYYTIPVFLKKLKKIEEIITPSLINNFEIKFIF